MTTGEARTRVVIAIPCHRDESGIVKTVESLAVSASPLGSDVRIVVCVNGRNPRQGAAAAIALHPRCEVRFLDVASKPAAWNLLRSEPADVHVFADADITVNAGAIPALVAALRLPDAFAAAGQQRHTGDSLVARVAAIPHRLDWGGLLGTLYAARTVALPEAMPPAVLLDDAWLFAQIGASHVVHVPDAVATVILPSRWRDLWRQRVRAEAGKAQLDTLGLATAPTPAGASVGGALRAYPAHEWPLVAALAAIKVAARMRARRGNLQWRLATSTKN